MTPGNPKAKRCTTHGVNFPAYMQACLVKGCDEELWPLYSADPDEDWRAVVDAINKDANEEIKHTLPHRYDAKARVYSGKDGMQWVTHSELLYNGYRAVTEGTIVFLNGTFYEVEGYVEKAGAWWVQEISLDGAADSLEPHMFVGD